MKIKYFIVFLAVIATSNTAMSQKDALEYMNKIDNQFENIMVDSWDYVSAASHGKNARKIENRRKDLLKTIAEAKKSIKALGGYDSDLSYRDTVVSYLALSYNVFNKDYAKIVDLEDIAEESYDNMEAYMMAQRLAEDKLDSAYGNLMRETEKFAAAHNITLLESKDKITKKLEISNKVIGYYNKIYLIYFKSYKQEYYMITAMNKGDVNGMEQNKNTLVSCATAGLASLDSIKSYSGDLSLVTTCKAVLNFYKTEASDKMKEVIEYYMAKESFDKIKTAFDSKAESARTKADVDQYNKAVTDINAAGKKFSVVNDDLNTKRATVITNWNNAVDKFIDTHVPKYKS
jgi:hypothetical protein